MKLLAGVRVVQYVVYLSTYVRTYVLIARYRARYYNYYLERELITKVFDSHQLPLIPSIKNQ